MQNRRHFIRVDVWTKYFVSILDAVILLNGVSQDKTHTHIQIQIQSSPLALRPPVKKNTSRPNTARQVSHAKMGRGQGNGPGKPLLCILWVM